MIEEKLRQWLENYQELIGEADYLEKRGYTQKSSELAAKAEGMREALEVFGYTVEEQYNEALNGNEFVIKEV